MDFQLRQQGRAAMAFMSELAAAGARLRTRVDADLAARGLDARTLADDLDQRLREVDAVLADSRASRALAILSEWSGVQHGRIGQAAFEEIRAELEPRLRELQQRGPATLELRLGDRVPEYQSRAWIHRTTGGWDGHPYQGFVHGELIHREYVARNFPGDIFRQRRAVLGLLPRRDYRRILEFGTSSGHYTRQIQRAFPQAEIWGCDLSPRMLEQAQRLANEQGWAWKLFQLAAEDTGFEPQSFDLVTSYIVLHEIPAEVTRAQLREAFRLLRPGGDLLFTDVTPYAALDKLAQHWAEYSAVHGGEPFWREAATLDLAQLARDAGFVDVRSEGFEGANYPWVTYGHKPE
ncbi:MAG: class I SAM-dependent methyltransferase [Sinobacteraceae bacterium]|nr:class I SAM-dependent methyltransferase [Nevskiaceae bacterium]MCP5340029.1 class I SAM-dependent methyltransferase [Nevskiaceae bacterium]MCP5359253.1 class I SAM-dependent methyltransferase [Nevskiaceae bacterium]MCP5466486.1 class I SAM-dependent methyltransferase [Nevskiaceae bacterium]MCP5471811.1 class I SAM-dependent methyltransferase [Nevskiaceae bacterium]